MTPSSAVSGEGVGSLHGEVVEVEHDLALRKLLWESLEEWQRLVQDWQLTPFESLLVDDLQKDVTRFVQTVFLLEKGTLIIFFAVVAVGV